MKLYFFKAMLGCALTTMIIPTNSAFANHNDRRERREHRQATEEISEALTDITCELSSFFIAQANESIPDPDENPELRGRWTVIEADIASRIRLIIQELEEIGLKSGEGDEIEPLLLAFFTIDPASYALSVYENEPIAVQQAEFIRWQTTGAEIEEALIEAGARSSVRDQFQALAIAFSQEIQANAGRLNAPGVNPDNLESEGIAAERIGNDIQAEARRLGETLGSSYF